jgi:hypothetical protein
MGSHQCSCCIQLPRVVCTCSEAEYVGDGVIIKILNEMGGRAGGVVVNVVVGLQMVEAGHGMDFHPLWPWEKWVHLGGGHGLCNASILSPCMVASYVPLRWHDWQRDTSILSAHPGAGPP